MTNEPHKPAIFCFVIKPNKHLNRRKLTKALAFQKINKEKN